MLQHTHGGVHASRRDDGTHADGTAPEPDHPIVAVNDTVEDAYWRNNFRQREYADDTLGYDHYRPAYRYGWVSRAQLVGRRWDEVERQLQRAWRQNRGVSRLGWTDARLAVRDAWQRVDRQIADSRNGEEAGSSTG